MVADLPLKVVITADYTSRSDNCPSIMSSTNERFEELLQLDGLATIFIWFWN